MNYRWKDVDYLNCMVIMEKNRTVSGNDKESTGNALKSEGYPLTRCEE